MLNVKTSENSFMYSGVVLVYKFEGRRALGVRKIGKDLSSCIPRIVQKETKHNHLHLRNMFLDINK